MITRTLALSTIFAAAAFGQSNVIWNENVQGDLSGNHLIPDTLQLNVGSNELIGTTGFSDRDYIHFNLAAGQSITGIFLRSYVSDDDSAFIAVQEGTFITEDPENATVGNLLGWKLFGSTDLGTDILPAMGTNWGSMGFVPPLTGANYSFWIQQTGDPTAYTLDFQVVPEPATVIAVGGMFAMLLRKRRAARS